MSQHREDRDEEGLRAFLLVLGGADPRDVARGAKYGWEMAIGIGIGLAIAAVIYLSVLG